MRIVRVMLVLWTVFLTLACQSGGGQATATPSRSPVVTPSPQARPTPLPGRPAVPPTSLQITGSLTAATDPAAGENACFFGQPFKGEVRTTTPQMLLPDGQAIGVALFSPPIVGTYLASSPAGDGRAIVRAQRTTRPAGGGDSGDWYAVSGTLTVTQANNLGDKSKYGVIAGTVDARLRWPDDSRQINLQGTWGCVIDPIANGS